jgi:phosphate transport system permease protein
MTGIIIGIARILGETAPLLIIGMAIFTTEIPSSITDASASLSTQIYLWSKHPEISFKERTGAAIIILILIIALLNILATIIKNRLSKLK